MFLSTLILRPLLIMLCNNITNFLIASIDSCLLTRPNFETIVCGDLNRYNINSLCSSFDLVNKVTKPTRKESTLDYFLVSSNIANSFHVKVENPIANSDHNSILCTPTNPIKNSLCFKRFFTTFVTSMLKIRRCSQLY